MVSARAEVLHTAPHKAPITGPSVWSGADFPTPDSIHYRLKPETIAEMDRALQRIQSSGKDIFSLTRDDFPLPSFEADAEALRHNLIDGPGFVVVKGLPLDRYTDEQACISYWGVGAHLGHPVPQNMKRDLLYSVRDEGYNLARDYGAAGVRTSKTTSGLNFHTDSAPVLAGYTPDIVCLLALQIAKAGGESAIVSGNTIHNILLRERPDYLERLYASYHMDRRAELPPGEPPTLDVPVFAYNDRLTVRYLRFYITKGHEVVGAPLTAADTEPLDFLDGVMRRDNLPVTFQMERGDMQFVNNVFILHSRTEFEDYPEHDRKRHYMRLWLQRR